MSFVTEAPTVPRPIVGTPMLDVKLPMLEPIVPLPVMKPAQAAPLMRAHRSTPLVEKPDGASMSNIVPAMFKFVFCVPLPTSNIGKQVVVEHAAPLDDVPGTPAKR